MEAVLDPQVFVPVLEKDLTIKEGSCDKIRLGSVQGVLSTSDIDGATLVNYVKDQYLRWVDQSEYLVLGEYDPLRGYTDYVAVKASKRGNDVYAKRIKDRLDPLMDLPDIQFFNYKDRGNRHKTRAVFVTLTYDPKGLTLGEGWDQVGSDYNRWISALRGRYGSASIIRVWEAHKNGYPHIHAVVLLHDHEFTAFHHNGSWRINEKRDLEGLWDHGFTDVEALSSTRGGLHYVVKYLGKLHRLGSNHKDPDLVKGGLSGLVSRASLLTLSLMWCFRKRAYSVSGDWIDLIRSLHNSNSDPAFWGLVQLDLSGGAPAEGVKRWVLLGFWSGDLIKGGSYPRWAVGLDLVEFLALKKSASWSDNRYLLGEVQ